MLDDLFLVVTGAWGLLYYFQAVKYKLRRFWRGFMGIFFSPILTGILSISFGLAESLSSLIFEHDLKFTPSIYILYLLASLTQLGHYLRSRKKYRAIIIENGTEQLNEFGKEEKNSEFE